MQVIPTDYTSFSDEKLVELAKSGNEKATNSLLTRMQPFVFYIAKAYENKGIELADLTQEGMIALIKALRTYNSEMNVKFKTYANSCINNHLSSTIRRLYRKRQIPIDKIISINKVSLQNTVSGPEDLFIENETGSDLMGKLRTQLSDLEFEIFKKYLSGYSAAEIADNLGINVKSVSNALYRIRQKFHSLNK